MIKIRIVINITTMTMLIILLKLKKILAKRQQAKKETAMTSTVSTNLRIWQAKTQ